jgi:hypothetical protein
MPRALLPDEPDFLAAQSIGTVWQNRGGMNDWNSDDRWTVAAVPERKKRKRPSRPVRLNSRGIVIESRRDAVPRLSWVSKRRPTGLKIDEPFYNSGVVVTSMPRRLNPSAIA